MRTTLLICAGLLVVGCSVNPVTGEKQLNLYDETWEVRTGEQNYAPMRQAQGGDYVLDEPLNDYVAGIGQRLAEQSDRDLPYEFRVLNSSIPNAWALPGGKIAINRGLLTEMQSEAELAAVIGHEIVHAAARHGAQAQSRAALAQGAVILGGVAVGVATDNEDYASVALVGGMIGAQLISLRYSRDAEREADLYGMRYMHAAGYNPQGAVQLQETFVRLSEERDSSGFNNGLFASHPPSRERVENNRRTADELGRKGTTGEDRYRRALGRLERRLPAYEAHDEGRKALADKRIDEALQHAAEAIEREPGEAIFHALRGDALAAAERWSEAESAYSDALARDESWFYHHLRRGIAREQRGRLGGARTDLAASLERLPTAEGHYYLGNVERAEGNRRQAIEHYRIAAQADNEAGRRARQALVEMGVEGEG